MNFEKKWDDYYSPLQAGIDLAQSGGYALEFGVATGKTLAMIASKMKVFGFDSFEGLPEDWREGFPKGMFAQAPPEVENSELVIGWFEDTIPDFVQKNDYVFHNLSLVHIDCDLYSATKTILDNIGKYLLPGVVVVFDEYHGYPGYEEHEIKAWNEFVEYSGVKYEVIGYGPEQAVILIV